MRQNNFPGERAVALLIDPDKSDRKYMCNILKEAVKCKTDYIMIGGSLTFTGIDQVIDSVRELCSIPVVLFPGSLLQLSHKPDYILLLSLISGRNPELLIGNHVIAAPYLRNVREKIISTGYILIGCGSKTSVEYISQTESIPPDKPEIVVATAMAGEMLGLSMIYLEAGSGALHYIPVNIIRAVRESISIPVAVGGGIVNGAAVEEIYNAGASLIILGNGCERNPGLLEEACVIRDRFRLSE